MYADTPASRSYSDLNKLINSRERQLFDEYEVYLAAHNECYSIPYRSSNPIDEQVPQNIALVAPLAIGQTPAGKVLGAYLTGNEIGTASYKAYEGNYRKAATLIGEQIIDWGTGKFLDSFNPNKRVNNYHTGSGENIFPGAEIYPYESKRKIYGQAEESSCVAAACRMLINDSTGVEVPEPILRNFINSDLKKGTVLSKVPKGIDELKETKYFDINHIRASYHDGITVKDLENSLKNGVGISVQVGGKHNGYYALVIDKIKDSKVYIRDPWPRGSGASYSISVEDFSGHFTGKTLMFDK